jgi:predicted RNA-binding Zn-ribbon protein involved in translation (DUF1610 family)
VRPVAPRALSLLVSLLEASKGRVVEDLLDTSDLDAFHVLRDCGALVVAEDVPVILCPACGDQDVAPQRIRGVLQGLCPECGYVEITNASLRAWKADHDWLLGRLRMAFGIATRQDSEELVPGMVWKVGDHKAGQRTRRIVFARRLADHSIHDAFRRTLSDKIERDKAVIISTTPKSAAMVSDLSLPFVHLAEIVHWRSGKLELDAERWAWCLKPAHLRRHTASLVFYDGYRAAIIDGEEYVFSVNQALVFEALDGEPGRKRLGSSIMADIGSPQRNPGEIFRHNTRQWEAFCQLVEWDDYGFYWLKQR